MVSAQDEGGCHGASGERDMKESSQVGYGKLGDESGDTGNGIRSTWLDAQYGEWVVTGGAERVDPLCCRKGVCGERENVGRDIGNGCVGGGARRELCQPL